MVKPEENTQAGTLHVLRGGGKEVVYEWTGSGWCVPGASAWQSSPQSMASLGWKYVGPKSR